jgi:hypothetical protein
MPRITQNLFEEIQKVTSGQIEEKKKMHDEDGDGDEDGADYMMKRRKAGGQSHAQAHAATRKHNEETYKDTGWKNPERKPGAKTKNVSGRLARQGMKQAAQKVKDEKGFGPSPADKLSIRKEEADLEEAVHVIHPKTNGPVHISDVKNSRDFDRKWNQESDKHRAEFGYDSPVVSSKSADMKGKTPQKMTYGQYKSLVGESVELGKEVKEEVDQVEEAWPGTPEHKAKFGTDLEKHQAKYGKSNVKKLEPYGYRGASGSETPETAADATKIGRGRKKMKEETIVKHDDFMITVTDNPTFQDFFNAAKSYVDNADDAVVVAEAFYKDENNSIIIESEVKYLYNNVFEEYKNEGYLVEDINVVIDESEVLLKYSIFKEDSEVKYNYIHRGIVVAEEKGEE